MPLSNNLRGKIMSERRNKKGKMRICDYPKDLRGLSTNRYGGSQLQRERGLRGSTFGPAGECNTLSKE
jgi:hypothetical protein